MRVEIVTDKEKQGADQLAERILNELRNRYSSLKKYPDNIKPYNSLVLYLTPYEFELLRRTSYSPLNIESAGRRFLIFFPSDDDNFSIQVPIIVGLDISETELPLQEILKQLVELHKYKQENGATEYYETKKVELWDKAYKAVGIEDEIL